jgi:hypothetical protein
MKRTTTVYMKVSDNSVIPGPYQFSNPYWDEIELASVSFHPFDGEDWAITVSGSDDGGLIYVTVSEADALNMLAKVISLGEIDVDELINIGFKDADSV